MVPLEWSRTAERKENHTGFPSAQKSPTLRQEPQPGLAVQSWGELTSSSDMTTLRKEA
jgi:hypothetical protein